MNGADAVYQRDTIYRDALGRFVKRPATLPAPFAAIAPGRRPHNWRARCVLKTCGNWSVVFEAR